jgi:hypothetical protein
VGVGPISFDPFTFTDGTTTWTMTRGVAGENYVSMCFLFAAAGPTSEISEQCSASTGPPDGATFFTSFTNYPAPILPPPRLPSSPGIYRTPFGGFSVYMGDPPGISSTGTVTLTVSGTSAVPEPGAFPLIAAGLVALLAFRPWRSIRKRSAEP